MKKREAVLWIQVPLKLLNPSLSQLYRHSKSIDLANRSPASRQEARWVKG
jgi:hypothetical protein